MCEAASDLPAFAANGSANGNANGSANVARRLRDVGWPEAGSRKPAAQASELNRKQPAAAPILQVRMYCTYLSLSIPARLSVLSPSGRRPNLQMRGHALLVLLATADALLLSGDGPSSRRAKLRELARLAAGGLAASCGAVVLAGRPRWTSPAWGGGGEELWLYSDDVATARQLASLQSANDMAPARRRLESDWATLRKRPVSLPEAEAAFATVLRARAAVARAEAAVRAASPRWVAEVEAAISPNLVRELEAAATVQTRSKPAPNPKPNTNPNPTPNPIRTQARIPNPHPLRRDRPQAGNPLATSNPDPSTSPNPMTNPSPSPNPDQLGRC